MYMFWNCARAATQILVVQSLGRFSDKGYPFGLSYLSPSQGLKIAFTLIFFKTYYQMPVETVKCKFWNKLFKILDMLVYPV